MNVFTEVQVEPLLAQGFVVTTTLWLALSGWVVIDRLRYDRRQQQLGLIHRSLGDPRLAELSYSESSAFVRQMLDLADGYDVAVIENDGFAHPLSAVYRRATLPYIEELLAHDRLRPAFLFDAVKTRRISPAQITADPQLRTLRNLNTREDYEQALAEAGL